ncbi:MAG TPA: Flp pilus assembly protein CpaB [Jatrophihabitantaceae bacterium]
MSISELAGRLAGWPRRILALCCLILAAVTALAAHRPAPARSGDPVLVAARDLAAGAQLGAADVRLKPWPDELRPAGALTRAADAVGHRVAGPVRTGDALTTTRLVGAGLTLGLPPNLRAVPVQVSGAALIQAGDSIDLLVGDPPDATGTGQPAAHVLAEAARVLAVTPAPPTDAADGPAPLDIVIAVDRATSLKIAAAAGRALLATLRDPP